ncbi:MAG: hypothetical protein M1826_004938 [Phylliscum demangeonii]|nr:MAG: hypothetical protein M1826_004938 [Phylliscum demangeonii]
MAWLGYIYLMSRAYRNPNGLKPSPSDPFACSGFGDGLNVMSNADLVEDVEVYQHDAKTGFATLPVHSACLSIAERVFERRRRQGPGNASGGGGGLKPTSLEGLYDAVNRQSGDSQTLNTFVAAVNWPHGYYGAQACHGKGLVWTLETKWMCADPFDASNLTAFILTQLSPVAEKKEEGQEAAAALDQPSPSPPAPPSALERLPSELLDHMTSYLPFAATLALARCSTRLHHRLLTQRWWREAVIAGDAVGFLWDLDPVQCRAKDRGAHTTDKAWDWRALARQLAARDCFDHGQAAGHDVPGPLRNRQRIWKIVFDVSL